jgi:hypothetical protein
MCDRLSCRAALYLLEKTNACKQNNYVIDQIMTEHCYNVPLRTPNSPAHLSDIRKRVATKKHDFKSVSCMLLGVELVADVLKAPRSFAQSEPLAQWHIAEDMNATAVRTWNVARILKLQMSKLSFLHSALVVSLTNRLFYPGRRHPLSIDLGV